MNRFSLRGAAALAILTLAIAGCQLAFFLAVQFIPPSLALLIEFMGPVLLVFWTWARSRIAPSAITLLGTAFAVLGLVAVSGGVLSATAGSRPSYGFGSARIAHHATQQT